jgi:hypothetical protein
VIKESLSACLWVAMGIALSDSHAERVPSAVDCQSHFTMEGSFLTGRKYSTWVLLPGVAKAEAYTRTYSSIAKDGWSIFNADKDAGIISSAQSVSFGKGSQAPMIVTVEAVGIGSKLSATLRTGGAQLAREETIRAKLCSYLISATSP